MVLSAGGNEQLGGSLSQARERYWCFKDLQVYNLQADFQNCSTKHLQTKKKLFGWLVFQVWQVHLEREKNLFVSSYHVCLMPFDKRDFVRGMK